MLEQPRTILIVEDDLELNLQYSISGEIALRELHIEGQVIRAHSYTEALDVLQKQLVDFISLDIALTEQEEGKTDKDRETSEAGGMLLLQEIQMYERQPLSIIISGEREMSYALDALQRYGVLNFFVKGKFSQNLEFKSAIHAALHYLNAAERFAILRTELDLDDAQASWDLAREAGKIAGIEEDRFPTAMGHVINAKRDELTHPVTGLPKGDWTKEILKDRIVGRDNWILIRATITGFNTFIAAESGTGSHESQEEPILVFIADLLRRAREMFADPSGDDQLFIGHFGGTTEYSPDPAFVLIPSMSKASNSDDIAQWITTEFGDASERSKPFRKLRFDQIEELEEHGPIFTIDAKTLRGADFHFADLHELLDQFRSL